MFFHFSSLLLWPFLSTQNIFSGRPALSLLFISSPTYRSFKVILLARGIKVGTHSQRIQFILFRRHIKWNDPTIKKATEGKRKGYCFFTYDVNLLFFGVFFHHSSVECLCVLPKKCVHTYKHECLCKWSTCMELHIIYFPRHILLITWNRDYLLVVKCLRYKQQSASVNVS